MNTSCMQSVSLGWSKTDRVRAARGSPWISLGVALTTTYCAKDLEHFSPQYCLLFSSFSHPGSSEIFGSPGIVSSPCVTLGTGAKHSWRKLAPFLTGMLVCDLLSISSASVRSLLSSAPYASTKSPPPCQLGGVHLTWWTGVMTQVWELVYEM